jgi:hypothetical protein
VFQPNLFRANRDLKREVVTHPLAKMGNPLMRHTAITKSLGTRTSQANCAAILNAWDKLAIHCGSGHRLAPCDPDSCHLDVPQRQRKELHFDTRRYNHRRIPPT